MSKARGREGCGFIHLLMSTPNLRTLEVRLCTYIPNLSASTPGSIREGIPNAFIMTKRYCDIFGLAF